MFKKRPRTERRANDREVAKLIESREKLAALEPGGHPSRPMEVPTASVIEVRATSLRCLACDGELRVHEHRAKHDLREVELACKSCNRKRTLYVRVSLPS
jgi:hypothetical protein